MPTIDLRKPIQICAIANDRSQYWIDAKVVAFSMDAVEQDESGADFFDLSFDAEFEDQGEKRIAKISDVFGWGYGSTWRYKTKSCEACKWAMPDNADANAAASDAAWVLAAFICDHPNAPKGNDAPRVTAADGEDCPFYEDK